jgi:hypothetical protein
MMKGVAEFWHSQIQENTRNGDDSLVVDLCNSPEYDPDYIRLQALSAADHQVFDAVLSVSSVVAESDTAFFEEVSSSFSRLDKGLHNGEWGQAKD